MRWGLCYFLHVYFGSCSVSDDLIRRRLASVFNLRMRVLRLVCLCSTLPNTKCLLDLSMTAMMRFGSRSGLGFVSMLSTVHSIYRHLVDADLKASDL